MIYQLLLITSLGAVTPLAVYPNRDACTAEQGNVKPTAQYTTVCLPVEDPRYTQARMEQGLRMMTEMMNTMKEQMR